MDNLKFNQKAWIVTNNKIKECYYHYSSLSGNINFFTYKPDGIGYSCPVPREEVFETELQAMAYLYFKTEKLINKLTEENKILLDKIDTYYEQP